MKKIFLVLEGADIAVGSTAVFIKDRQDLTDIALHLHPADQALLILGVDHFMDQLDYLAHIPEGEAVGQVIQHIAQLRILGNNI